MKALWWKWNTCPCKVSYRAKVAKIKTDSWKGRREPIRNLVELMLTFSLYLVHGRGWWDHLCVPMGQSLPLITGVVTVNGSWEETASAKCFRLLSVWSNWLWKCCVWNSAHSGPPSLCPGSKTCAVEMNPSIWSSQHPCCPRKSCMAQSAISAVNVAADC